MNSVDTQEWFCVRTKVGLESRITAALSRLSEELTRDFGKVEPYCPRVRSRRMVGGHSRPSWGPMFPGYIFARFCWATNAGRYIASRPGVIGIVRCSDRPLSVSSRIIGELRAAENTIPESLPTFSPGQKLILREGPFVGMEAEFVASLSDGQRSLLFLDYLQQRVNLLASTDTLKPSA
jgi:transcriptional antiterminator RfaH